MARIHHGKLHPPPAPLNAPGLARLSIYPRTERAPVRLATLLTQASDNVLGDTGLAKPPTLQFDVQDGVKLLVILRYFLLLSAVRTTSIITYAEVGSSLLM